MSKESLGLFKGVGVEIEYMTVNRETLFVLPAVDEILRRKAGETVNEVEAGKLRWSNEIALHVIELKTNGPAPETAGLAGLFSDGVREINRILQPVSGRLMPTAMHPWMNPETETRLWPYENSPIYNAYDRIFGCQGHGWSNLQSLHINLPFSGDEEFARLHAAIRLVLPLLPALAASSPVKDGKIAGNLDERLSVYRTNQRKIPSIAGRVVPEQVFDKNTYEREILERMYKDVAPFDPAGDLRGEWLNSRAAIARFERDTIEIRVIDVQEHPAADLAVAEATIAVLKALVAQRWEDLEKQKVWETKPLETLFIDALKTGDQAVIRNQDYLAAFGFPEADAKMIDVWRHLTETLIADNVLDQEVETALKTIMAKGPLARRILNALGKKPERETIKAVYAELCDCLEQGRPFDK